MAGRRTEAATSTPRFKPINTWSTAACLECWGENLVHAGRSGPDIKPVITILSVQRDNMWSFSVILQIWDVLFTRRAAGDKQIHYYGGCQEDWAHSTEWCISEAIRKKRVSYRVVRFDLCWRVRGSRSKSSGSNNHLLMSGSRWLTAAPHCNKKQ